jgi:hypothetical protein
MRRLFLCAALVGMIGVLSGCDEKKPTGGSTSPTAASGPRTGAGPEAPPPPPPPPPPNR